MNRYYLRKRAVLPMGGRPGDSIFVFIGRDGGASLDRARVPEVTKMVELLVEVDERGRFVRPGVSNVDLEEVLGPLLD